MRERIAAALQASGLTSLTIAGFAVSSAVGFAVAGVGMILFGLAVERS